jgi:hypothetical protein
VRKRQAAQDQKAAGTRSHFKPKGICQTQPKLPQKKAFASQGLFFVACY